MKKIIPLLSISLLLFLGCGGGSSSEEKSATNTTEIQEVESIYNYNQDNSAVRNLYNSYVNTYTNVQTQLDSLKKDKTLYSNVFDNFIVGIFQYTSSKDTFASYAPRGDSKSLKIDVNETHLDYSSYSLKGDIDADWDVDFDDIDALKNAMFKSDTSSEFDVNGDTDVNIKDVIEVAARMNTHIASFDFYNSDYEKLDIATRSIDDSMNIVVEDKELTSIIVVAKDENGASGFESGLSDSDDVWYKKSGWKFVETTLNNTTQSATKRTTKNDLLNGALEDALNITPDPYLIGWNLTVNYIETGYFAELDEYGLEGSDFYLSKATDKIEPYFRKTTMGNPGKVIFHDKKQFIYEIGSRNAKTNEVKGKRVGIKHAFTLEGETVFVQQIASAFSILFESAADKTLSGKIESEKEYKGTLNFHRIGPEPKEEDFETTLENSKFTLKNIPFGAYAVDVKDACQCSDVLEENFIFDTEKEATFTPNESESKVNVVLKILDKSDTPQKNKKVELRAKECLNQAASGSNEFYEEPEEQTTDSSGKVSFSDVLIGDYDVYVDDKRIKVIHFCENTNQDIIINPLWRFDVTYTGVYGSGSMSVLKFPLEVENFNKTGLNDDIVFVGNDYKGYEENVEIFYSGVYYDSGLSPLNVYNSIGVYSVDWSALVNVGGLVMQVGSMYHGYHGASSSTHCDGELPTFFQEKAEAGEQIKWSSGGQGAICTFIFEPCTNESCSKEQESTTDVDETSTSLSFIDILPSNSNDTSSKKSAEVEASSDNGSDIVLSFNTGEKGQCQFQVYSASLDDTDGEAYFFDNCYVEGETIKGDPISGITGGKSGYLYLNSSGGNLFSTNKTLTINVKDSFNQSTLYNATFSIDALTLF